MKLPVFFAVSVGIALGIGAYTFFYARGYSYLSNNPKACVNCHVMQDQYNGWIKSSHHTVATCNDCHTPHNLVGKYTTKALNGFWHSYYFTMGNFSEPIRITKQNFKITENACRHCHTEIVHNIDVLPNKEQMQCTHCHKNVGHFEE